MTGGIREMEHTALIPMNAHPTGAHESILSVLKKITGGNVFVMRGSPGWMRRRVKM